MPSQTPEPRRRIEPVSLACLAALQRLPALQRAAFILHDVIGFRLTEVAYILDRPPDIVDSMVSQARTDIARYLGRT